MFCGTNGGGIMGTGPWSVCNDCIITSPMDVRDASEASAIVLGPAGTVNGNIVDGSYPMLAKPMDNRVYSAGVIDSCNAAVASEAP